MKHHGNVTKINGAGVEPVDIITFGSPCQDLSVAGKRAGIQDGERSNLFFEAVRIIKEMREATNGEYPKYAVWENVPGAFSSNKGHDFHAVLEALCSVRDSTVSIPRPYDAKRTKLVWSKAGEIVGDNYSVAWRTLDAQYWGVPQRRKRIYLVADFTGRCAGEILFKSDSLRGNITQSNETGQSVTADAVGGVDGSVGAAGVVSKGNGDCFIMPERHMSLSVGGGQAGQGYPCVLHGSVGVECLNPWDCQSKRIYKPDGIYCTLTAMDCGGANNQTVIYSFDSLSSNSMKSSNPFSGCRAVEVAKCIDTTYPDPSKNQGGVAVVQQVIALQANGIDRAIPINDKATRFKGGGDTRKNDGAGNGLGVGNENVIVAKTKPPRKYIIRRLTPTECARLQGFPNTWDHLAPYDPADADFWEDVRKTHAEINGKVYKPVKDIKKWYDKLHTDGAEYKAYGNGLALPCAEYVIRGIAEQGAKTLGSLFDGIGGFPLAGVLNGITPLWASEVEPYAIAVTKSRFKEANNG